MVSRQKEPPRTSTTEPNLELAAVAPAFVAMAHEIVWAGVATVDANGRPRSRIRHPIWEFDDETCAAIWERFVTAPPPVGYDPAIIPAWSSGPTSEAFAVLILTPWRLRVFRGTVLTQGEDKFSPGTREPRSDPTPGLATRRAL